MKQLVDLVLHLIFFPLDVHLEGYCKETHVDILMDHLIQYHNVIEKRKLDQSLVSSLSIKNKKKKESFSVNHLSCDDTTLEEAVKFEDRYKLYGGYEVNSNSIVNKLSRLEEIVNLVKIDKTLSTTNLLDVKGYGSQIFIQ